MRCLLEQLGTIPLVQVQLHSTGLRCALNIGTAVLYTGRGGRANRRNTPSVKFIARCFLWKLIPRQDEEEERWDEGRKVGNVG
jgi:hypothetical protein